MQYDERSNGSEISLAVNDHFEITLSEIRTAGYHWSIAENGEPVLQLSSESSQNPAAVGGAGVHIWRFCAAAAGTTNLKLEYRRQWENSAEPARTFSLKIHVGSQKLPHNLS